MAGSLQRGSPATSECGGGRTTEAQGASDGGGLCAGGEGSEQQQERKKSRESDVRETVDFLGEEIRVGADSGEGYAVRGAARCGKINAHGQAALL